jgi:IS605 OrfB family transposase
MVVNRVWNYCNELQKEALQMEGARWPSNFDLDKQLSGISKLLKLSATTLQEISKEYVTRRKQFKKPFLNFRSNKKSLHWIPFKGTGLVFNRESGEAKYVGFRFKLFNYKGHPIQGEIKTGSICADSRGRFYLNLVCKIPDLITVHQNREVGIDLGLKDVVTLSDGTSIKAQKYFRKMERKLAKLQQAGKKKQLRNLHAKIKNRRRDFNHKLSRKIVNNFDHIYVGDVSPTQIAKKSKGLAKSVMDASWYQLKTFISYKALANGGFMREVKECYSTQTCSSCGSIPKTSPKGTKGLNIREWVCSECGAHHLRDVNAAKNILGFGRETPLR